MTPHVAPLTKVTLRVRVFFPGGVDVTGDSSAAACSPQPTPVPAMYIAGETGRQYG